MGQELNPLGTNVLIVLCRSESIFISQVVATHDTPPSVTNETNTSELSDATSALTLHIEPQVQNQPIHRVPVNYSSMLLGFCG